MTADFRPEVLAPAGNFESLTAAVRCGADAVYFGAGAFNARLRAAGFGPDDIAAVAAFCRARGVKTYLTLNTLVTDDELPDALRLAEKACEAGVNALILQDLGLAAAIAKAAPGMPLHASTQMSVHTPSGLRFLRDMGFARAVLARELSEVELRELTREAKRLGMETEVFVHGALCMSVSGQCALSAALGGRSGNRGDCAQPCRLPFRSQRSDRALSLKDLNLLPHIPVLREMGVTSLKIEGRLKRPEYAAAAVTVYRAAAEGRTPDAKSVEYLQKIFSRGGFTDGYFTGLRDASMFGVRSESDKSDSRAVQNEIHELYRRERPAADIRARLFSDASGRVCLTLSDGTRSVTVSGDFVPEPALRFDENRIRDVLARTGGTPFVLKDFEYDLPEPAHLPASVLSALRAEACEKLLKRREIGTPVPFDRALLPALRKTGQVFGPPKLFARFRTAEQYDPAADPDLAFLPADTDPAFFANVNPDRVGLWLPRGLFGRDRYWARRLNALRDAGLRHVLCENLGAVRLATEAGLTPVFGDGMNVFNAESARFAFENGAKFVALSKELPLPLAARIAETLPAGVYAYGHLPLMLLRNCPAGPCGSCRGEGFLTDRKNTLFRLGCAGGCSELYNPYVRFEADRLRELRKFDFLMLYFTFETREESRRVVEAYRRGSAPPERYSRMTR